MRKVALATATVLALGLTAGAAQADKVIIKKGHHFDHGRHLGLVEHRDEGWRRAHAEGSKVIIKRHRHLGLVGHRDEGWRRAHAEGSKVIIKRHRHFD